MYSDVVHKDKNRSNGAVVCFWALMVFWRFLLLSLNVLAYLWALFLGLACLKVAQVVYKCQFLLAIWANLR